MRILKSAAVAIGLSCLAPIAAHAQCNVFFPSGTICGNSTGSQTTPRAGLPSAFGIPTLSANNTWTGTNSFTPILNGTIQAFTVGTIASPVILSGTIASDHIPLSVFIRDSLSTGASSTHFVTTFNVQDDVFSTSVSGGRIVLSGTLSFSSPTAADNAQRNYVALAGNFGAFTGDNGTIGNTKGAGFGSNFQCRLNSGANYWDSCSGIEVDVGAYTGTTGTNQLYGVQVVRYGQVVAAGIDAAFDVASLQSEGGTPWKYGLLFDERFATNFPVSKSLIKAGTGAISITRTLDSGIDFSEFGSATFTQTQVVLGANNGGIWFGSAGGGGKILSTTTSGGGQILLSSGTVQITGNHIVSGIFGNTPTVVASLPTCNGGANGLRSFVTNSNAAMTAGIGAIVAAGGANNVPVFCDGTNWRIG